MTQFGVSNIALTARDHESQLMELLELGFSGLEVAPSRVWHDSWHDATPKMIDKYRRAVERAGLEVIGLHSLLFDQPKLDLFGGVDQREELFKYFCHLSSVCRDLGGQTMVWGAGRHSGDLDIQCARDLLIGFVSRLIPVLEAENTILCLEPLGPTDTNILNTVRENIEFVDMFGSSAFKIQMDAKAMAENNEVDLDVFRLAKPLLVHYHVNDLGLGALGNSGAVDHKTLGASLKKIGYDGFVSLEQRQLDERDPIEPLRNSLKIMTEYYR